MKAKNLFFVLAIVAYTVGIIIFWSPMWTEASTPPEGPLAIFWALGSIFLVVSGVFSLRGRRYEIR